MPVYKTKLVDYGTLDVHSSENVYWEHAGETFTEQICLKFDIRTTSSNQTCELLRSIWFHPIDEAHSRERAPPKNIYNGKNWCEHEGKKSSNCGHRPRIRAGKVITRGGQLAWLTSNELASDECQNQPVLAWHAGMTYEALKLIPVSLTSNALAPNQPQKPACARLTRSNDIWGTTAHSTSGKSEHTTNHGNRKSWCREAAFVLIDSNPLQFPGVERWTSAEECSHCSTIFFSPLFFDAIRLAL